MSSSNSALREQIVDLKGRLDRGEGEGRGKTDSQQQHNWSTSLFVTTGIAMLAALVAIVIAVYNHR